MFFNEIIPQCILIKTDNDAMLENLIAEIEEKTKLKTFWVNEITKHVLDDLLVFPIKCICVLNDPEFDLKKQNMSLKFIEDYSGTIIIRAKEHMELLSTIISRTSSVDLSLNRYTSSGQNSHSDLDQQALVNLCQLILNNITRASIQNTLTLTKRINPDKENNCLVFLQEMKKQAISLKYLEYVNLIMKTITALNTHTNLNKNIFIDNFLLKLRNIQRLN